MKTDRFSLLKDPKGLNFIVTSNLKQFEKRETLNKVSLRYVAKGTENYIIDDKPHIVKSNNFLIINPMQEVQLKIDSKSNVVGKCFFLDPSIFEQISYSSSNSIDLCLTNKNPKFQSNEFNNIPVNAFHTKLNLLLKNNFLDEDFDEEKTYDYLITVSENIVLYQKTSDTQLRSIKCVKRNTHLELYKRIQIGRQYLHDNLNRTISIKEVANACMLSEYYFHRNFRKFFQLTPYEYHKKIRMIHAQSLFRKNQLSKEQIALSCGYDDTKYFSKVYNKWLNRTS